MADVTVQTHVLNFKPHISIGLIILIKNSMSWTTRWKTSHPFSFESGFQENAEVRIYWYIQNLFS